MDIEDFRKHINSLPLEERVKHKISELKGKLSVMDEVVDDICDISSLHHTIRVLENLISEG